MKVPTFDFMKPRRFLMVTSLVMVVGSLILFAVRGLNYGLDFTGGTLVEISFSQAVEPADIRAALGAAGFENGVVQHFGTRQDVVIRMPQPGSERVNQANAIRDVLLARHPDLEVRRSAFVGPVVGQQLRESAGLALLVAFGAIMVYVMFRFTAKFAIGGIAALIHDAIVTVGAFALFGWTFDLTVVAAVLALIGYSINDTIVIFDRIRENFPIVRRGAPVDIFNLSINQTLSRTLMTSGTVLLVLFPLLILGGDQLREFSIALIIGVLLGVYSTVYVASGIVLELGISREDMLPPKKEGVDTAP